MLNKPSIQPNIINFLSSPKILYYSLIGLMVVLIVGTIAQKYVGLYIAQRLFFDSFIIWLKFVPIPGMRLIILIIAVNLLAKLIFKSPWNMQKAGIIITHIGVFVLLLGSGLTVLFSHEGNIVIFEGEDTNIISDYHNREFVIYIKDGDNKRIVSIIPDSEIFPNKMIKSEYMPFAVKVLKSYKNSTIADGELSKLNENKDDEINIMGIEAEILLPETGALNLILTEDMAAIPNFALRGYDYFFELRKQQRTLPFSIHLEDFSKQVYSGTNMAKSYSSKVQLIDEKQNIAWKGLIEMNQPLRYKGYTFFQSSFIYVGGKTATVLAVVQNRGRLYPYIASGIICIGLLLHLFLRLSWRDDV